MMVSQNHMIPQLKNALKMREKEGAVKEEPKQPIPDDTIDLEPK